MEARNDFTEGFCIFLRPFTASLVVIRICIKVSTHLVSVTPSESPF